MTPLCEFDKIEWWDVCQKVRPDITFEEYEIMWDEFVQIKRTKDLH